MMAETEAVEVMMVTITIITTTIIITTIIMIIMVIMEDTNIMDVTLDIIITIMNTMAAGIINSINEPAFMHVMVR
jgi:hypothetical protein